ncbi:MAG: FCD domain-containing protein [Streptosporangiales bacterium]|nr:FCD domain-containing protein [Streptosporangiales bacterium]
MEQAHRAIKDLILTVQLRPGEQLDDIQLAAALGFSRTPVREALFQLGSDGLVTVGTRGGFMVRPLDLFDVGQLFEAHVVVARSTARLLAVRATDADLADLDTATKAVNAAIARRHPASIAATNAQLHRREAEAARNEHLKRLAWSVFDQGQRLAFLCFGGDTTQYDDELDEHFTRVTHDHEEFLDAIRSRDPDRAEDVAARHVRLFRTRTLSFLSTTPVEGLRLDTELVSEPADVWRQVPRS